MRKLCLIYFSFLIVPLIHFPEIFFSNYQLGHPDHLGFLISIKDFFFTSLRNGDYTWFYPYHLMGVPLSLGPHYQILYPLNIFWILFENPNLSYKLQFFFSYFLLQFFFFHFLNSIFQSKYLSFCSTILIISSPIVWSTHLRPLELDSLNFLPLSLWMSIKFLQTKKLIYPFISGLAIFLSYLSGDPVSSFYGFIFNIALFLIYQPKTTEINPKPNNFCSKIYGMLIMLVVSGTCITPLFLKSYSWLNLTERSQSFSVQEKYLYSSHPVRILEVIFPLGSEIWNKSVVEYSNPSWWYERIGFGIVFTFLIFFGLLYKKNAHKTLSVIFFSIALINFYLSFGEIFETSKYIWENIPPFNFMRFPERILKNTIIPLGICFGIGLHSFSLFLKQHPKTNTLSQKIILVLCFITLLEMQSSIPSQNNTKPLMIQQYPEEFPKLGIEHRIHVCSKSIGTFIAEKQLFPLFEPRMWKIPQLIASEASFPLSAKRIDCDHSLSYRNLQWLGITHILTPWFDSNVVTTIENNFKLKQISYSESLNYILFQTEIEISYKPISFDEVSIGRVNAFNVETGKPYLDPYWFINENGHLKKDPNLVETILTHSNRIKGCTNDPKKEILTLNQNKSLNEIVLDYQNTCPRLLLFPISFAPGWRAFINNKNAEIFRLNDWVIGIFTDKGSNKIQLSYSAP